MGGSDKIGGMKKGLRNTWANIRSSAEWWSAFVMILTGLTALAVMFIFGFVPLWFPEEWGKDEMSILERMKFAAYLVGGVFLIWQLRISNRRATALEKTAASGEKGNITERFKNAIEHLAHDNASVQTGGIYTLYHVAKEAEEYKETVLKILLAHLRKITVEKEEPVDQIVMAILDALFAHQDEKPLFDAVDLSYINLKKIGRKGPSLFPYDLSTIGPAMDLDLTGAYFGDAHLSGANMSFAICEGTIFNRSLCVETGFHYATFNGASCNGASFDDASFDDASCNGASFYGASFDGASFIDADLSEADFLESNITAKQLLEAKTLYKAKLPDAVREKIMRESPRLLDKPDEDK